MIRYKIKDFFTSFDKKNTILYNFLNDRIKIEDIKYLTTYGKCGMPATDSYILINKIQNKLGIKPFLYGFWESGMITFNSIEICNGKCEIGVEYNGR
jgi:hypothetical protein